jgi:hypothetical protein
MKMVGIARIAALVLAGLAVVVVGIFFVWSPPTEVPLHGRELYMRYCGSCHGVGGKGDGPASKALRPRPTDLTRLRARDRGEYPIRDVMAAIDGRYPVRAHGDSAMPVWGAAFEQEMEARKAWLPRRTTLLQVRLIAEYVLSLQQ